MAHFLNQLSKTLHEATRELLDMFAINVDTETSQGSDIGDSED